MAASAGVDFPDGAGGANLDVSWIHGSEAAKYNTDPDIQVQRRIPGSFRCAAPWTRSSTAG